MWEGSEISGSAAAKSVAAISTKDALDGDEDVSDVTESEQRLDDVRDQTMRDEGRMP